MASEIPMNREAKQRELESLRQRVDQLEAELSAAAPNRQWQTSGYYTAYYATTGFLLGMFAAASSLLFNIVGALLTGRQPLDLIRVYLTFPLGDRAMEFTTVENGMALAIGVCLYLGTGMLLGVPVYLALTYLAPRASLAGRLVLATVLGLGLWIVNFYLLLSWVQPALVDMKAENLIVRQIPWWVAMLTHLVFAWTLAVVYPLGLYKPFVRETEKA